MNGKRPRHCLHPRWPRAMGCAVQSRKSLPSDGAWCYIYINIYIYICRAKPVKDPEATFAWKPTNLILSISFPSVYPTVVGSSSFRLVWVIRHLALGELDLGGNCCKNSNILVGAARSALASAGAETHDCARFCRRHTWRVVRVAVVKMRYLRVCQRWTRRSVMAVGRPSPCSSTASQKNVLLSTKWRRKNDLTLRMHELPELGLSAYITYLTISSACAGGPIPLRFRCSPCGDWTAAVAAWRQQYVICATIPLKRSKWSANVGSLTSSRTGNNQSSALISSIAAQDDDDEQITRK